MEVPAYQFVVFVVLVVIGIIALNSITSQSSMDNLNNYTLNFTENPQVGSVVTVDSITFEFVNNTSDVSPGYVPVLIDNNVSITAQNFGVAVANNTQVTVR
jgi:hypothetical protein